MAGAVLLKIELRSSEEVLPHEQAGKSKTHKLIGSVAALLD
jgi:hypothetical protein